MIQKESIEDMMPGSHTILEESGDGATGPEEDDLDLGPFNVVLGLPPRLPEED